MVAVGTGTALLVGTGLVVESRTVLEGVHRKVESPHTETAGAAGVAGVAGVAGAVGVGSHIAD